MNRKKLYVGVLIGALLMIVFHILNLDFDQLSNMDLNLGSYGGILSMALIALAMYSSIKNDKNNES